MESSEIKLKWKNCFKVFTKQQKTVRVVLSLRPLKSFAGATQLTQQKGVEAGNYTTIKIPKP